VAVFLREATVGGVESGFGALIVEMGIAACSLDRHERGNCVRQLEGFEEAERYCLVSAWLRNFLYAFLLLYPATLRAFSI